MEQCSTRVDAVSVGRQSLSRRRQLSLRDTETKLSLRDRTTPYSEASDIRLGSSFLLLFFTNVVKSDLRCFLYIQSTRIRCFSSLEYLLPTLPCYFESFRVRWRLAFHTNQRALRELRRFVGRLPVIDSPHVGTVYGKKMFWTSLMHIAIVNPQLYARCPRVSNSRECACVYCA